MPQRSSTVIQLLCINFLPLNRVLNGDLKCTQSVSDAPWSFLTCNLRLHCPFLSENLSTPRSLPSSLSFPSCECGVLTFLAEKGCVKLGCQQYLWKGEAWECLSQRGGEAQERMGVSCMGAGGSRRRG